MSVGWTGSRSGGVPTAMRPGRAGVVLIAATAVASGVNLAIAAAAVAAGADPGFRSLSAGPITGYTVLGVLVGLAGWAGVRRLVPRPLAALRIAVPVLAVLSFVPDLPFFADPAAGPTVAVALMLMHVVVVAVVVPVLQRVLPVGGSPDARP